MENKKWLLLIIFGFLLITSLFIISVSQAKIMGYNSNAVNPFNIENIIVASYTDSYGDNHVDNWSLCRSIYVYLNIALAKHNVSCALYDDSLALISVTEEKSLPVSVPGPSAKWYKFNFSSYIVLNPSKTYKIAVWANSTIGSCNIRFDTALTIGAKMKSLTYNYPSFPNPFVPVLDLTAYYCIYIPYNNLNLTSNNIYPVNNSYAHTNITLSAYCSVSNGGKFNYTLYKMNGAGIYYKDTYANGVTNLTIYSRWFNATKIDITYNWKVCLKNYTNNIWSNKTYAFKLKFHNETLTNYYNLNTVNGSTSYCWNNTIGFKVFSNYTYINSLNIPFWLNLHSPNPGNGTLKTNFLVNNISGMNTSINVSYRNFTYNDNQYIYAGGDTGGCIYQYWKNNLTERMHKDLNLGDYYTILQDSNYVYCGQSRIYKLRQSDLYAVCNSSYVDFRMYCLVQDKDYLYEGGRTSGKIQMYYKSNLTKKMESAYTGGYILSISIDDTYVYIGSNSHKVFQYWKNNLTKKAESSSYGDVIYTIVNDDTYLYVGGYSVCKVFQYWKSNLTKKTESLSYGGDNIQTLLIDSSYVYAVGAPTDKIFQYWKSNLTKKAESLNYTGYLWGFGQDNDYLYAGGATVQKIYQYYKTNLTKKIESDTSPGNVEILSTYYMLPYIDWNNKINVSFLSNSSGSWLKYYNTTLLSNANVVSFNHNFTGIKKYYWKIISESNHHTWFNTSNFSFTTLNTTAGIVWINNHKNTTWSHYKILLMNNSWKIYDNDTGNITSIILYQKPINSSGTHTYILTSNGYIVYANYTGNKTICPVQNSTNLTLFENIFNATGTHQVFYNSTLGWFVYANYSGNITIVPLNNFTVGLNFTGLNGYISWTGDYTINQTNISFNVSSNMSLNGSVNVNEDDYFLSGILTFENSQFFLMLLIGLWLFFVSEYVKYKETMLAWIQLIFAFPVTLFLSSIAYFNSIPLILPVIFIIPILGIYLVADAIYYSKKPKKNK